MMAVVFAEPMSRPATMRSGFIGTLIRGQGEERSLESGDHLVTKTEVDLRHAYLAANEILLDGIDIGETVERDILHGPHGPRVQPQHQLVAAFAANLAQ